MQTLVQELCNAGIELELMPDGCIAVDAGLLNDNQRQAIRTHKQELVQFLLQARTEAEATEILIEEAEKMGFFDKYVDWRPLAKSYQAHANNCPQCVAGGQGRGQRCAAGASLWQTYQGVAWGD